MNEPRKKPALWKRILDWPLTVLFSALVACILVAGVWLSVKTWRWATGYSETKQRLEQVERRLWDTERRLWKLEHER